MAGSVGRVSSFEVVVDGKLAYSKLSKGVFPDFARLADEIAAYAKSGSVPAGWQ